MTMNTAVECTYLKELPELFRWDLIERNSKAIFYF